MFDLILSQPLSLAAPAIGVIFTHNACKGVGKLGNAFFGQLFRKKEYRDALMRAQAERDAKAIKAGEAIFDGEILHPALALPDFPQDLPLEYLPMLEGQRQEASNLNANLAVALDLLVNTPDDEVSDEPVSPDWFARWRREAQIIGEQVLQDLWGRILAEEIKKPQSVSLKTLDVLKNVTAADANLFCDMLKLRIKTIIISNWQTPSPPYSPEDAMHMENLGLLFSDGSVPIPLEVQDSKQKCFLCQGFVLLFDLPNKSSLHLGMHGHKLSIAGLDILKISDNISQPDWATIKNVGDYIWKQLPSRCKKMEAKPLTSATSFDKDIVLHQWHR